MSSIPDEPRERWVIKQARAFIKQAGICWLPVRPIEIARRFEWEIWTVGQVARRGGFLREDVLNGQDSDLYLVNGQYKIIYNELAYHIRIPYTIAHEIGHIVLKHLEEFEQTRLSRGGLTDPEYWVLEREAEIFAAELLMPLPILRVLGAYEREEIMRVCSVSKSTAGIRSQELIRSFSMDEFKDDIWMQKHFALYLQPVAICSAFENLPIQSVTKRNPGVAFKMHKHEYIATDENGRFLECPQCGNKKFSKDARYCRMCGLYLYNYCENAPGWSSNDLCGQSNPGDARYCEHCGSETRLISLGLLKTWEEVLEEYGEVAAGLEPEGPPF